MILLIACGAALARAAGDQGAVGPGIQQIRTQDGTRLEDLRSLERLEAIASRFDAARAAKDERALGAVNDELRRAAAGEMKIMKAEERRRTREERANPQELSLSIMVDRPGDGGEARPDPAEAAARAQERRQEIALRLRHLGDSMEPADLDRERAMIGELIDLARLTRTR